MKKFILSLTIMLMAAISMNAQIARQTQKPLDNVYVSAGVGAATQMSFNGVFPLNTIGTVKVGKYFTPVWGANVEGTVWFGDNAYEHLFTSKTFVKSLYAGANATTNWSNLLFGYKGSPRFFEVSSEIGLGWIHEYRANAKDRDDMGAKTGLNFVFNLGSAKAWSINVEPAVYWNLTTHGNDLNNSTAIAFCKNSAQLALTVGVTYHFKTSNGTHAFKLHDVGALNDEINSLRKQLAEKPKTVTKIVTKNVTTTTPVYVLFAQGKADLSDDAKATLDAVSTDTPVDVFGYASPEGTTDFNLNLSQKRANVVANYLKARGVKVNKVTGEGVNGDTSNRVVIVK